MTRLAAEDGSAVPLLAPVLVTVAMLAVAIVDATGYLVAAADAQATADAAALAAVTARDHPTAGGDPEVRAERVTAAAGARLERCDWRGSGPVEVEVSVAVHAAVMTRFAGRRVHATAQAELVDDASGRSP